MSAFKGQYKHALDDKSRVNMPAKLRKALSPEADETFVVTRGLEECIFVYPFDEWRKIEEKLKALPVTRDARYFVRVLISHAHDVQMDDQGRILLPQNLLEFAKIDKENKEILIIGALERIEIWNPELFQKYLEGFEETYEEIAEKMMS